MTYIIKNRIEAMNKLHKMANKIVPVLREDIAKNGFKVKASGSELFVKDASRLKAIYEPLVPDGVMVWLSVSSYSNHAQLILTLKTPYKTSDFTCDYYEIRESLNTHKFQKRAIYCYEKMMQRRKEALKMIEDARELESDARELKSKASAILVVTDVR